MAGKCASCKGTFNSRDWPVTSPLCRSCWQKKQMTGLWKKAGRPKVKIAKGPSKKEKHSTLRLMWAVSGYEQALVDREEFTRSEDDPNLVYLGPRDMRYFVRFDPAWMGRVYQDIVTFLQEQYGKSGA